MYESKSRLISDTIWRHTQPKIKMTDTVITAAGNLAQMIHSSMKQTTSTRIKKLQDLKMLADNFQQTAEWKPKKIPMSQWKPSAMMQHGEKYYKHGSNQQHTNLLTQWPKSNPPTNDIMIDDNETQELQYQRDL